MRHQLPVTGVLHILAAACLILVRLDDRVCGDILRRKDADEAALSILVSLGEQGVQGCLVHHAKGGVFAVRFPPGDDAIGYP
jgi:hypothetical protein